MSSSDNENEFPSLSFEEEFKEFNETLQNTIKLPNFTLRPPRFSNMAQNGQNVAPGIAAPPQQINWELLRSRFNTIKPYDGDFSTLNKFLIKCDTLVADYAVAGDATLNRLILDTIQGKLTSRADILVGNRTDLNDWVSLRAALVQCFSDRRDLDCLVQELTRARPFKNENLISFGTRVQYLVNTINQRVQNQPNLTPESIVLMRSHYDKTALNTFIAGCSGIIRNNMYLRRPASLEEAIAHVHDYENFEKLYGSQNQDFAKSNAKNHQFNRNSGQNAQHNNFQQSPNFMQNPQPNYSQNMSTPIFNQQRPQNPNFTNQNFNNQNNFAPRQNFPSGPVNIQPRYAPPKRFFTNEQVFGPKQNVFRPNQIPPEKLPKPTPMSTTSRNTFNSNQRPQSSSFQNQNSAPQNWQRYSKPQYHFEELFTNDCDQALDNQYYNNDGYYDQLYDPNDYYYPYNTENNLTDSNEESFENVQSKFENDNIPATGNLQDNVNFQETNPSNQQP